MRHICNMYFSSILVRDLISYGKSQNVDTANLENSLTHLMKEKYVSYDAVIATFNYLNEVLADNCLGLHIGEQITLKSTAYVDNIMLSSESLEDSITNAIKYSKLISDALDCTFKKTDEYYSVLYEENPNWKVYQAYSKKQILDLALLSNLKSLITYTGYKYRPICINFNYEKPKKVNEYYRLFNCRLKFNQANAEIIFDKTIIDRHSKSIEFGLLENLKNKVEEEIENLASENELIYRLKKCILNHKPQRVTIVEASRELNLSARTLQRKLRGLNTTFKKIEYSLQLKLSKTYLEENEKSIDEISYLLGFSESSAFIRFFKSLIGKTPMQYVNSVA